MEDYIVTQNTNKKLFWFHTRSFPLHGRPNVLLVNYDSWWQHQMSVRELRHDRPSGWFSKSRGLSASVSFLSSPLPPRSFTCAICRAVSLILVPRSLLLNRTETLAMRLTFKALRQQSPTYAQHLITRYLPSRSLRSSSTLSVNPVSFNLKT